MPWQTQSPCEWQASNLNTCPAVSDVGWPPSAGGCTAPISHPLASQSGWPCFLLLHQMCKEVLPCLGKSKLNSLCPSLCGQPLGIHIKRWMWSFFMGSSHHSAHSNWHTGTQNLDHLLVGSNSNKNLCKMPSPSCGCWGWTHGGRCLHECSFLLRCPAADEQEGTTYHRHRTQPKRSSCHYFTSGVLLLLLLL